MNTATRPRVARTRRFWWITGITLVVAISVGIAVWSHHGRQLPPTRARAYQDFQACLLTGDHGVTDPAAQPLWAAMQDASLKTHAKVSYLAVTGPPSLGNALPYATTLIQRQCNIIIALGDPQTEAITQTAPQHPEKQFITIGGTTHDNITAIPTTPATTTRADLTKLIEHLAP
jgi:basic membrane lipoprotein Med (substrate-binding protein (PBP1-ABC) superfamily)